MIILKKAKKSAFFLHACKIILYNHKRIYANICLQYKINQNGRIQNAKITREIQSGSKRKKPRAPAKLFDQTPFRDYLRAPRRPAIH